MSRRTRPALAAAAAVLALAAVPLAAAPSATAATTAPTPVRFAAVPAMLPPLGAEAVFSTVALDSQVRIGADVYSVDFRGGLRQRVDVNPDNPLGSVRLRTAGFRVSGRLPDGGTLTLEQNDVAAAAESTLTRNQQLPARYEERDVIAFTATIERPGQDMVVLEGATPMVLTAKLTRFPARGDSYRLAAPVNLVDPADHGTVTGTLQTFTAQRADL